MINSDWKDVPGTFDFELTPYKYKEYSWDNCDKSKIDDIEHFFKNDNDETKNWLENFNEADDDEIWYFFTHQSTWATLAGRAGFVIMKNGYPTFMIIETLN